MGSMFLHNFSLSKSRALEVTTAFKIFVDGGFPGFLGVSMILKLVLLVRLLVKLNREKAIIITASSRRDICAFINVSFF